MESKHNLVKIRAFTYLELCSQYPLPWRSARDIQCVIGSKAGSLYVLLSRWVSWGYLIRQNRMKHYHGRYINMYSLAEKGINYLKNLPKWYEGDLQTIRVEVAGKAVEVDPFLKNKVIPGKSTGVIFSSIK